MLFFQKAVLSVSKFYTHSDHRFHSDGEIFFIKCQDVVEGKGHLDNKPIRTNNNSENHKNADGDTDIVAFLPVEEGNG